MSVAQFLTTLFGFGSRFKVARNHYEQAARAFEREDWEAANSQFRSACDAAFDALAHAKGCAKKGGNARKWLQENGFLEDDEADLIKAFMVFAGRDGSHAGISEQVDAQLRRHMATAVQTTEPASSQSSPHWARPWWNDSDHCRRRTASTRAR